MRHNAGENHNKVEGHWFYKGRPVVPDKQELQWSILQQYHDYELAGHPGIANNSCGITWVLVARGKEVRYGVRKRMHHLSKYQAKYSPP